MTKTKGLAIVPLDYTKSPPPKKCAWVVFLLSTSSYLPGILVLHHSLVKYGSKYPLIVAVNPQVPKETVKALEEVGLEVRVVKPLKPCGKVTLIADRFVDTWTKCVVFDFIDYDRVVLIDGDMMLRKNMDELFNLPLKVDEIAATFACVCNLDKSDWAPDDWTRENCPYTQSHYPTSTTHPGEALPQGTHSLLNSGLVVLTPSQRTFQHLTTLLTSTNATDQRKISNWMFPDQDLLADLFKSKWYNLPWTYNAIKTMRYWHGNFYRDEDVRNLHYICDKPWRRRPVRNSDEVRRKSGLVYRVDWGKFKGVRDGTLGLPMEEADAVCHGWWWEEYEAMVGELRERGYGSLSLLESLVDGV